MLHHELSVASLSFGEHTRVKYNLAQFVKGHDLGIKRIMFQRVDNLV